MGKSKVKPEKVPPKKLPHCKICHCEVTPNDGLQCKGPCRKWAHYECLDMTAGKIADVKSGAIIINCPCPNCEPSEFRAEVPYNCFNKSCPFNLQPQCTTTTCQKNSSKPNVPPPPPICGAKPKPTPCGGDESPSDDEQPAAIGSSSTGTGSKGKGGRCIDTTEECFDDEVELRQSKAPDEDSNRSKLTRRTDSRPLAEVNLGHIIIGYSLSWSSPILPKLLDSGQTPLTEVLSLTKASWVGSSIIIGAIIGPYLLSNLLNIIGRKWTIILASSTVMMTSVMVTLAKSFAFLFIARILNGVAMALIAISDYVYIGEMASSNIRGLILSSTAIFHAFGGLLVYSVGPFVSYSTVGYVLLGINSVHFLGCLFIPESPVYYMMKGKQEEARISLRELGRDKDLEKELEDIKQIISKDNNSNWKELFSVKSNRKCLYITAILAIFQESSGMLAITNFAMIIFEKAGSSVEPAIATIIIGATSFLATPVAPIFIDKYGRRMLLFISTSGVSICMTILGIFMYLDSIQHSSIDSVRWIPLATMMTACGSYTIGLHCVPNTLIGEFYRPNVRSLGTSISLTVGWSTGLVTIASFGYIVEGLGSCVIFFFFAVVNALGFLFVLYVVPETKGLTLPEIERVLSK